MTRKSKCRGGRWQVWGFTSWNLFNFIMMVFILVCTFILSCHTLKMGAFYCMRRIWHPKCCNLTMFIIQEPLSPSTLIRTRDGVFLKLPHNLFRLIRTQFLFLCSSQQIEDPLLAIYSPLPASWETVSCITNPVSKSESSCFHLPGAGMTGKHHSALWPATRSFFSSFCFFSSSSSLSHPATEFFMGPCLI